MSTVTSFEDLVYGPDGERPMYSVLERVLGEAKNDGVRLQIDVRLKDLGATSSRNEHQFAVDPEQTAPDAIMRVLHERLANESPGEEWEGKVRINFSQAGSSHERYGSYTRTLRHTRSSNMRRLGGFPMRSPMPTLEDDEVENDLGEDEDLAPQRPATSYARPPSYGPSYDDMDGMQMGGGVIPMEQAMTWMEAMFNMNMRAIAQNHAMFQSTIAFLESVTVRYGIPTSEPGIIENKGGTAPQSPMGAGLLPMLLKAAASLAQNDEGGGGDGNGGPGGGQAPAGPSHASDRARRIHGASSFVRQLPQHHQRHDHAPPPPIHRPSPPGPGPDLDEGGMAFDEEDDFTPSDYDEEPPIDHGPPDITGLSPDEVKELFIEWIRADPDNRKGAVLGLVSDPELLQELA